MKQSTAINYNETQKALKAYLVKRENERLSKLESKRRTKRTIDEMRQLRDLRADGYTLQEIGDMHGVTRQAIHATLRSKAK